MAAVDLSILIASLFDRKELLKRLLSVINPQLTPEVELLISITGAHESVGSKRQRLLKCSNGRYVCFVDDDDLVADDYVMSILGAIRFNDGIDCIGFKGTLECENKNVYQVVYSLRNKDKIGRNGDVFECGIGHLTPIRREIATSIEFPESNHGEDSVYCSNVMEKCKGEVFIDKVLYRYFARYNV